MKKALIIFVRHPELGKVKTRLAKDIGNEKALLVYKNLLQHTHNVALETDCLKYVFYTDTIGQDDIWEDVFFIKKAQLGDGLGDRMQLAFNKLFAEGFNKIIIIGSDCPELNSDIITSGFEALKDYDAVIGPSLDGGYYLLGVKQMLPEIFTNKNWSTSTVLEDTLTDLRRLKKTYTLLPPLYDVDTGAELLHFPQLTTEM